MKRSRLRMCPELLCNDRGQGLSGKFVVIRPHLMPYIFLRNNLYCDLYRIAVRVVSQTHSYYFHVSLITSLTCFVFLQVHTHFRGRIYEIIKYYFGIILALAWPDPWPWPWPGLALGPGLAPGYVDLGCILMNF